MLLIPSFKTQLKNYKKLKHLLNILDGNVVLADSLTGYTYDFLVYTGKSDETYNHRLGCSVVMKLIELLLNLFLITFIHL